MQHASEIAARPRQASNEACSDRVGDVYEHYRDRASFLLQRGGVSSRMCEDHVGVQCDQLFREHLKLICPGGREAMVDADIEALRPSKPFELLSKFRDAHYPFRIVLGIGHQHSDAPYAVGLLGACSKRPRSRRAAQACNELAPLHVPRSGPLPTLHSI